MILYSYTIILKPTELYERINYYYDLTNMNKFI
jgi:hypothetical protein